MAARKKFPELSYDIPPDDTPERRLIAAVLENAIIDAFGSPVVCGSATVHVVRKQALSWLLSRCTKEWSLNWICEELNISAKRIRKFAIDSHDNKVKYIKPGTRTHSLRGTGDHRPKRLRSSVSPLK